MLLHLVLPLPLAVGPLLLRLLLLPVLLLQLPEYHRLLRIKVVSLAGVRRQLLDHSIRAMLELCAIDAIELAHILLLLLINYSILMRKWRKLSLGAWRGERRHHA